MKSSLRDEVIEEEAIVSRSDRAAGNSIMN
jgi:hypothetical protein